MLQPIANRVLRWRFWLPLVAILSWLLAVSVWIALAERYTEPSPAGPAALSLHSSIPTPAPPPPPAHIPVPEEVRGIYWTAGTAASAKRRSELMDYMERYGLNTVVVDLKIDSGALAFTPNDRTMAPYVMEHPAIADLDGVLDELGQRGIYRIARIAVMRDGAFASIEASAALGDSAGGLWRDNLRSLWVDPAAPEVAAYAVALGREAYARGFDEVQYDYVRFATDGATKRIVYPVYDAASATKASVMSEFFKAVGGTLQREGIPVSFDIFGLVMWGQSDVGIGQQLTDVAAYADFISPMVYPSHYAPRTLGFPNPAQHPYEIVRESLERGVAALSKDGARAPESIRPLFRPWLQDFDLGASYTADMIQAQIRAARESGASGWLLWNARNVYEPTDYRPKSDARITSTAPVVVSE